MLVISTGCASTSGKGWPVDENKVEAKDYLKDKPGYNEIVISRFTSHNYSKCNVKFMVNDDTIISKMRPATHMTIYLSPGPHTFKVEMCERRKKYETREVNIVDSITPQRYAVYYDRYDGLQILDNLSPN